MNRRLLIISPYFPPSNAADMQRVRMSLPYFKENGWDVEVVVVDEVYSEMIKDDLLLQTVPPYVKIHKVKAWNKSWTAKLGLGSLALRSFLFYRERVNQLLKAYRFDLIYFSTTQFPICVLGAYWKRKFNVPYVIDMQDPWHSDFYRDKPRNERPPKYWFSYRLNKHLEPLAMKSVDGVVSVSQNYLSTLEERYSRIKNLPTAVITFGAYEPDLIVAKDNRSKFKPLLDKTFKNIVYIGRGGADMHAAIKTLFTNLEQCSAEAPDQITNLKFYFIGTSYAPNGEGKTTILPLAAIYGLENRIEEVTDRISYYHALVTLQDADALFIPGSEDQAYTASKIYPYLLTKKPILAIFNDKSPATKVLKEYGVTDIYHFNTTESTPGISDFLLNVVNGVNISHALNVNAMQKYSADFMAKRQCRLFEQVLIRLNAK